MKFALKCVVAAMAAAMVLNVSAVLGLTVGDPAPDFTLQGSDGKTYKLSEFKGKQAVVIAWYPKAMTSGCTIECKSLKEAGNELRKFDVAYFGASVDKPEANKEFSDKLMLDFPLLSDPTQETAKAYHVLNAERGVANRTTIFIDKNGKIAAIEEKVNPQGYGTRVAAKLKELGVAEKK
jgi:peroxiredoxin Q/BCP